MFRRRPVLRTCNDFCRQWNRKVCCVWNDLLRYARISHARKRLLREAMAALAIARMAMAFLRFRRIAAWLGTPGVEGPTTATAEEVYTAQEIGWAVGAVARRVPWNGSCLAQALAATGMLRRRGLEGTVSFGARPGGSAGFDAHAWLRLGPCMVTGGPDHQRFQAFTSFARKRP
ncbi:MAG: lasso peptide biosynthesis B2 protein [Acidobacteriaceae bacterium]